ncbi:MAG: peptidase T [Clostridiales bacterium]|jgi:tripeptide aminopeptidase|nr:peptidase T [Clostridiales bacterium]
MSRVIDRFMRYISIDTQSDGESGKSPSTAKQFDLARVLASELKEMGASDVRLDEEHCYVYAEIPANDESAKALGFISHMDTAESAPGDASNARIVEGYDGSVIKLNDTVSLDPEVYPDMKKYIGQDLIVTDGVSLLGADDKAGVAEIMECAQRLLEDDSIKHGRICIAFTPDEEIGCGTDYFDIDGFKAESAYTVDGGGIGEMEYENFNAATAFIRIKGKEIHPGEAKDVMINAVRIAAEFEGLLPQHMSPEHTEGYEGFLHLTKISGGVGFAEMQYLIRDHDEKLFEDKKELMKSAAAYINSIYGDVLELEIKDAYRNMKEIIDSHMYLVEDAEAAFRACGVEPHVIAIRGGTDGAQLSYKGLPCPNLSTGGHNFHSNTEYVPVQSIETMVDVLTEIARSK